MNNKQRLSEVLIICAIIVLSVLIANKALTSLGVNFSYSVLHSSQLNNQSSSLSKFVVDISPGGNPSFSSFITKNEYINTSSLSYNSNFWLNEKFYPGNISSSSQAYSCSALSEITGPHVCIFDVFALFSCGGGPEIANFTNLVGYLGFPQVDNKFPNSNYANYSNLYSAVTNKSEPHAYQLPSSKFPYQNFINWSNSTIHPYSDLSQNNINYIYAINTSFTGYTNLPGSIAPSTLIIPAVSCGSTFINNYITYPGFVGNLYNISTLSGFTPSVFLASPDQNAFGVYYSLGYFLTAAPTPWTGSFNSLLAYQVQSISPAFNYTMPSSNYAQFPKGNKGDLQYLNVTTSFLTPLSMSYFGADNSSSVEIYVSNKGISAIADVSSSQTVCVASSPHGGCLRYGQNVVTAQSADTFTSPDLEGAYYPDFDNGQYVDFRTDGIFPICAWNSTIDNTLSSCTFENPKTVNNISYERLWLSNNLKYSQLYDTPFYPSYLNTSQENNFTLTALDSFCFYGESFNTADGVYTSPSYTRVIPPTAAENYTSSIGTCNAFFNNTNCFSKSGSEYLNFEDGIFASNIKCTYNGIQAQNITDAWINSIYVANDAGDYCGLFKGQKNPANPEANSTLFLQNISTNCPAFNVNSSSVNLVITVKNVGNTVITNPYLVALYGNDNISSIFYNSQNNQVTNYELYQGFLSSMSSTTGIIQVDYNNNFDTNMYVFDSGHPLNPIPLNSLFSASEGYENGPFNNSLLGMWIYDPQSGVSDNVIRTSNTLLAHSDSGSSNVPVIAPNGTATFTLQVPMSLFEALLSGKYNLSVFFGNSFNVTWNNGNSPASTLSNPSHLKVNPLVPSSTKNASDIHNNELITNNSEAISPIWQYIVSYNFNLTNSPLKGTSIYNDNVSIDVNSVNSTSNALNVTVKPSVSVLNGSGSYSLGLSSLKGSSISCFVSPDNVQDFGVFWSKQIVSPSNLNYALSNSIYSGSDKQASQVLVTSWTGILFMPYSDQVALNYDNLPQYVSSTSSFQLEKPTLNQTSGNFNYEAFAYFGNGSESNLFRNLSGLYNSLNSTVKSFPVSLPSSSLPFTIISDNLVSDPSLLRIIGTDTLVNYSTFSNKTFTFSLTSKGSIQCSYTESTSVNATFESGSSISSCLSNAEINNSYINISSSYGPFYVDMYNNSNLNMSNKSADGTILMSANETLSKPSKNGLFMVTLPINVSINNGVSLVFSVVPLSKQLYNSTLYLYNINGTPFDCNIVNAYNNSGNLGVTEIKPGEYSLPNGTIMCNINSDFTYLRAVFMNKSNNAYLGSGDVQSGLSIQNISNKSLNISINGVPINVQDLSIIPHSSSCSQITNKVVYNGIVNYPTGCNLSDALITFDYNENGSILPESAFINPSNYNKKSKGLLYMESSAISDAPISEYNLTIPNTGIKDAPIQFTLINNFGGCNNIRLVTQSPYPYTEVPYQVTVSSSQSCDYVFIGNSSSSYSVFESNTPSIQYSSNLINYNSTPFNVELSTNLFNADLISNCKSGFGPCVDSFSVGGKTLGNLLFNNVSTSSAAISPTITGPVEDCFTVSYSSSQTVNFAETGFGSINYANTKIFQTATPSQAITSMYCFYAGSPIITDVIHAQGSPINFKVENQLIANFSYLQDNALRTFYVPPSINVGYNKYNNVNLSSISPVFYNITTLDNIKTSCYNYTYVNSNLFSLSNGQITASNISSSDILTPEKLYCIYGSVPSYTPQSSLSSVLNENSTSSIGFAYQPGNYTNGIGTLYDSCTLPSNLSISSSPYFYVNGNLEAYSSSNSGENYMLSHSSNNSGLEMLYSPKGSVFIQSCSINETILSYTACTKPVPIIPSNGSYDSIEAIPTGSNGNLSFGGGCYIGSLNGISYNCAPTDGNILYSLSSKDSSSLKVSVSKTIMNSTDAKTSAFSVSFDCSISITNSTNSEVGSCSYPNNANSGICAASVSYKQINSTEYNITAACSALPSSSFQVKSSSTKISNLKIQGSQSEKTGLISASSYICGNETNLINSNVLNGWNWEAYSTAGSINPVTTTNPNGIAEVGGCEAGRDSFITANPSINITNESGDSFKQFYSCQSGYTGTITACSSVGSLSSDSLSISSNTACAYTNTTLINTTLKTKTVNGNGTGGQAQSCNPFSKSGYISPTVQDNCIAYHSPVVNSTVASYELQYINSSSFGVGMGVIGNSYPLNISIPNSKQQNSVKDAYFTGLSESQIEGSSDILTDLLPTSLLESNLPSKALSISADYSYDLLNILMLQNPSFGVSGIPGFINGSILDYALSLFTGGTSGNCAPPYNVSGDGIFTLGEGELCSGKTLPSSYKEGIFLSLGTLNEGLHSLQFYSIGNSTNQAQPSVSVFDSVGNAVNLNSACSNGNNRVFTSTYSGGKWSFNITSDQQCDPINNKLYGYIVNCLYETPGNKTYAITSQYYLAYNLPTIWNISYTLLVSPKSYEVVPTPVYQINYSNGSILTLQQPNKTTFIEHGLPVGYKWNMVYNAVNRSSSGSTINFYSIGTHSFNVSTLSNSSVTNDCRTIYTPSPSNGYETSGTVTYIQFTGYTTCYTYFNQTGLPKGLNWNVTYGNMIGSTASTKIPKNDAGGPRFVDNNAQIEFVNTTSGSTIGNYSFSIPSVNSPSSSCPQEYIPNPSSGYLLAGSTQSVVFTVKSNTCATTFTETGLPKGTNWSVTYNKITESATLSSISFSVSPGTYSFNLSNTTANTYLNNQAIGRCVYVPQPSSGSLSAGATQDIHFSSTNCTQNFTYVSAGTSPASSLTLTLKNVTKGEVILVTDTINQRTAKISDTFGDSFSLIQSNTSSYPEYYMWSTVASNSGSDLINITYSGSAYSYATAIGLVGYNLNTLKSYYNTTGCSISGLSPSKGDFVFGTCQSEDETDVTNSSGFYAMPPDEPFASSEYSLYWPGGSTKLNFIGSNLRLTVEEALTISPNVYSVTLDETGLPSKLLISKGWTGSLAGNYFNSTSTSVSESSTSVQSSFSVNKIITDVYCNSGFYYEDGYKPVPSSGNLNSGQTGTISFQSFSDLPTKYTC